MWSRFAALLISFAVCIDENAALMNKEVTRTIDATTAVVKVKTEIKAVDAKGEYAVIFPNKMVEKMAYFSASIKGKPLRVKAPVANENYTTYAVEVADENPAFSILAVFTDALAPYPSEITQSENQLVLLKETHYFYSPYVTATQKLSVKLASGTIEGFTKVDPYKTKGSLLTFGPFLDVQPFSYSPLTVHYVNNFPFAKFSTLQREVEVSHWGNIAIEEIYELQHAGAKLKGGFSRFEHQARRGMQTPSFRNLIAVLPAQANNIYYRDQIGNISTSDMRFEDDEVELEIQTRFPIFGGWKTQFYLGYSIPTEIALFLVDTDTDTSTATGAAAGDRYSLKVDFFTVFEDVWVEDMEVKVILPEGCTDVKVDVPYSVEQSTAVRYTFLDSELNGGRPVLILHARNLVEQHDEQIVISYTFARSRMVIEPMMLVASFFVLFLAAAFLGRTTAIGSDSKELGSPTLAASAAPANSASAATTATYTATAAAGSGGSK